MNMNKVETEARAASLVGELEAWSRDIKLQTAKPTIYDTAWITMLYKPIGDDKVDWIFPECFWFLLNYQQSHGGWTTCDSKVDGILGTLAATLALKKRCRSLESDQNDVGAALDVRISRAVGFLLKELSD